MVLENAARGEPRLVLGRERVLVEALRRHALGGQEVQRQERRACAGEVRGRDHFLAGQRADDEVRALALRQRERLGDALRAGVVDAHARAIGGRRLVVRGHEAVAHADGGGRGTPGDRQQQRDVRAALAFRRGRRRRVCQRGGDARLQVAVTRRLRRRARLGDRAQLPRRLLRLAALERRLGAEQRLLGALLGGQRALGEPEHARRILGAVRGQVVAARAQQEVVALGAAVLRGQLLVDARRAQLIAGRLELRRAIHRGRQAGPLAEARAAAQTRSPRAAAAQSGSSSVASVEGPPFAAQDLDRVSRGSTAA